MFRNVILRGYHFGLYPVFYKLRDGAKKFWILNEKNMCGLEVAMFTLKLYRRVQWYRQEFSLTEGNSSWNVTHSDTIWQSTRVSKICKNLKTIGVLTGDFSISVVRMIKNSFLISALITPSRPRINSRHKINISLAPKKREDNKRNYVGQTIDKWSLYSSHVAHSAEAYPSFPNPLTP